MSSTILLSIVLIHCELMPRGKLINSEQKKQVSISPILIACTCGRSKTEQKNCWWCWGLQDGDCLWWEMSKQHGEQCNSWLSLSRIQVCWLTRACHRCCCSWIVVYVEPLHPGHECATRIPRWWKILQRFPTNYLQLLLQNAFEGLNGQ